MTQRKGGQPTGIQTNTEETSMNTTYFDEMTFNCAAYERAKKEREERKAQIAKVHGYNSPEMDAWYTEDKAAGPYGTS